MILVPVVVVSPACPSSVLNVVFNSPSSFLAACSVTGKLMPPSACSVTGKFMPPSGACVVICVLSFSAVNSSISFLASCSVMVSSPLGIWVVSSRTVSVAPIFASALIVVSSCLASDSVTGKRKPPEEALVVVSSGSSLMEVDSSGSFLASGSCPGTISIMVPGITVVSSISSGVALLIVGCIASNPNPEVWAGIWVVISDAGSFNS